MSDTVKLSMAQRSFLAKVFNDELRNHKYYTQMGPTQKAFYQECVQTHFMPIKSQHLPPYPVKIKETKHAEGRVIDTDYTFELEIHFNQVGEGAKLTLTKPIKKGSIDHVV